MNYNYDFIIVGSGLYGAVTANRVRREGYSCLVLEKRNHIGGNVFTETIEGIQVHRYGAHIFHTSDDKVWSFINRFGKFNNYVNSPIANYKGEIYNLPFNMNTFNKMWGVVTPKEAMEEIERQRKGAYVDNPQNLQEQAINLVGYDIFEKLIKGYTEKQWGRPCTQLPPFIIKRLPVRFTYDNNYFNDSHQGIPCDGYTAIIEKLLEGIELKLETDFLSDRQHWMNMARVIIYTGPIDAYFDYRYGALQYRGLRFETECLDVQNYQGNAVVNYTDKDVPYTRVIEHKHFLYGQQEKTIISREYSAEWTAGGGEPFYPVNDPANNGLYGKYLQLALVEPKVKFGGRLAEYRYYDMDKVINAALERSTPKELQAMLRA